MGFSYDQNKNIEVTISCISSSAEGGQLSPLQEPIFVKLEFNFPCKVGLESLAK